MFQIALCAVLLAGAGILTRTFERLRHADPGFDADHLVTFTAVSSLVGYSDE